jgi:hypothetical protein
MNNINYEEALKHYFINLRENRDKLLVDSDKYLLPDFPINSSNLELIKQYRQELRDYMNLDVVINYNYSCNTIPPEMPKFPF